MSFLFLKLVIILLFFLEWTQIPSWNIMFTRNNNWLTNYDSSDLDIGLTYLQKQNEPGTLREKKLTIIVIKLELFKENE